jgi:hypothetical protein
MGGFSPLWHAAGMRWTAEELGHGALDWLLHVARRSGTGLAWSEVPGGDRDPTLYFGTAGVVIALLEGHRHFGEDGSPTPPGAVRAGWPSSSGRTGRCTMEPPAPRWLCAPCTTGSGTPPPVLPPT